MLITGISFFHDNAHQRLSLMGKTFQLRRMPGFLK